MNTARSATSRKRLLILVAVAVILGLLQLAFPVESPPDMPARVARPSVIATAPITETERRSQVAVVRLEPSAIFNPFGRLKDLQVQAAPQARALPAAVSRTVSVPSATSSPTPQAPPVPVVAPQVAPPLPFVAVGAIAGEEVTQGAQLAFIRHHDQVLVVRVGDSIASSYRVEAISTGAIQFTHLPTMQRQTLSLAP